MNEVLIQLDGFDKKHITELSNKCNVTNRITLEDYISSEALLELIEEVYYKIESLEEDKEDLKNQLNYPELGNDYTDRLYEERRMEN